MTPPREIAVKVSVTDMESFRELERDRDEQWAELERLRVEVKRHRAKDAVLYEHALGFEMQSVTMRYMRRFVALVIEKCGP